MGTRSASGSEAIVCACNVMRIADIPDLDLLRETVVGRDVRIRLVNRRDENVLRIGRRRHVEKVRSLPHGRDREARSVDQSKLRISEVVEDIFIVFVGERVTDLVRAARALGARVS